MGRQFHCLGSGLLLVAATLFGFGCEANNTAKNSGSDSLVAKSDPGRDPSESGASWEPAGDPVVGKLIAKSKCQVCHKIDGKSATGIGPEMNENYRDYVAGKMVLYRDRIAGLKIQNREIYDANATAIEAILALEGHPDQQMAVWLRNYIANPTFDRVSANGMTPIRLSKKKMDDVIAYLLSLR